MKTVTPSMLVCMCLLAAPDTFAQQPSTVPTRAWALKPVQTPGYRAPQRPWVKLADLNANDIDAAMRQVEGAYSLVTLSPAGLIGVRDPHGVRPLVLCPLRYQDVEVLSCVSYAARTQTSSSLSNRSVTT